MGLSGFLLIHELQVLFVLVPLPIGSFNVGNAVYYLLRSGLHVLGLSGLLLIHELLVGRRIPHPLLDGVGFILDGLFSDTSEGIHGVENLI